MKKLMKEILVIFVLMAMLINSSLLMIVSTALDAISEALDESKINNVLEMSLEKYVNYSLDEQTKGTLVQMNVKTGIEYAEGQEYKPLEYTETFLQSPKIEGEYPERVEFIAKSTKATNGDDNAKDFGYEYDNNSGTVRIGVKNNEDEQGNIYSENVNGARDEFVVLYYYGANCYNDQNVKRELEFKGKVAQIIYNDDKSKVEKEYSYSQEVTENIGGLISTNVSTGDLYNGYIYSNMNNGTDLDTEYTENTQLSISYKEISDEIVINQNTKFIDAKDDEVDTQDVVYKGAKINKDKIVNVLGEDFKIYILNDVGETIAEINKDTETDENGIIDLNYDKEYTNVNFKVSKPVKVGYLQIENKKAIKSTMKTIENNKIKLTQEIICQNNIQEKNEQTGEVQNEYTKQINAYKTESIAEIQNSESKVELHSDKQQLTNSTKNDIILTAVLKTNDAKYNLFKNPEIEIEMPSEVDNVILGDVSLLYDGNLNIKNYEVQDKNGIKVIRIQLDGTQLNYNNSVISEGANIIIPATVIVDKDIYSTESSIKLRYSNETGIITSYAKQGKDCEELQINIDSMNVPVATYSANSQTESAIAMDGANSNVSLDGLKVETVAQVGGKTLKSGDTVYEKEVINYIVNVTNTTENEMNNVNVKATVPDGTTFITKDGSLSNKTTPEGEVLRNDLEIKDESKRVVTENIKNLEANKSYEIKYAVIVNDINNEEQKNIENKIYINESETENKINLIAKKGKMKIDIYPARNEVGEYENMYLFEVVISNTSNEKITNVQAETILSTEMELNYVAALENEYDSTSKKLKINVGDIEANSYELVAIRLNAIYFKEGISEYNIPFDLEAYGDNTDTYRGDTQYVKAYSADVSVKMESPTEGQKVKLENNIEYNVTIKNDGAIDTAVTIIDNLPEYVTPISAKYNKFDYNSDGSEIIETTEEKKLSQHIIVEGETNYDFKLETLVPKGKTINITIIGEAGIVEKNTEVSNTVTVYGNEIGTKLSNSIVHTILPFNYKDEDPDEPDYPIDPDEPEEPIDPDEPTEPTDPDEPQEEKTYYISGKAWLDSNKDGIKNSDEELLNGITVKLFNSDTNAIVQDEDGKTMKTTTNDSGEYKFENVSKGNYLVIFEYDSNMYTTTTYQASEATSSTNSDAIAKEVAIDGQNKIVGVTDILNVKSGNIEDVDIGLVKSQIFDLKLDKYVSKITVKNTDGTKEYSYKNSKLAKVEIASKKIANSTVEIEYKIVVTNEGEINGEVNEVIDYLPEGLNFDNSLNNGWYKAYDGSLRNSNLTAEQIKPGESKEISLILTKTMTENSTGKIENIAEIGKVTNANLVNDKDSTPGNKKEGEDDYSKAEVIISIKTGIVEGISIVFIVLSMLIIIAYVLKNKKINKTINFFVIFVVMIFMYKYGLTEKVEAAEITYNKVNVNNLWIEKLDGVWQHKRGINGTLGKENGAENLGFICVTPGAHLCESPGHDFKYDSEVYYDNWNNFLNIGHFRDICNTKNEDGTNLFGLSESDFGTYYSGYTGGAEITKKSKGSEAEKKKVSEKEILGPYKYSLTNNIESYQILLNGKEIRCVNSSRNDGNGNIVNKNAETIDLNTNAINEFEFFINLDNVEKSVDGLQDIKEAKSFEVEIKVYNSGTVTKKGISVLEYHLAPEEKSCTKNAVQTLKKLRRLKEETSVESEDSIKYSSSNLGDLKIKKIDEIYKKNAKQLKSEGETEINGKTIKSMVDIPGVKDVEFILTGKKIENEAVKKHIESNNLNEEDMKYINQNCEVKAHITTNSRGIAKVKDLPAGGYYLTEIKAPKDYKYPYIDKINYYIYIEGGKENQEWYSNPLGNQSYYYFEVEKVDADDKKKDISGAKISISKYDEKEKKFNSFGSDFNTTEQEHSYKVTNIKFDSETDVTYKIEEIAAPDNYYFDKNEKGYTNSKVHIKYHNGKFYIAKYDDKTQNWIYDYKEDGIQNEPLDNMWRNIYKYGKRVARVAVINNSIRVQFINFKICKIGINKVNEEKQKEKINGVKFKIYFISDKCAYYIKEYKYEYNKDDLNSKSATIIWTSEEKEALSFITGVNYTDGEWHNSKTTEEYKGEKGQIILEGVPKKVYYAEETESAPGFQKLNDIYITGKYEENEINYFSKNGKDDKITNPPLRVIGIKKVDEENTNIKIDGVKFIIWRIKDNSKEYLVKYKYDNDTNESDISWSTDENEAIEFVTGKNYLDGNKYWVNSEGKTSYTDVEKNENHLLCHKEYDSKQTGQIILKGMESKTYYAKEKDASKYYEVNKDEIYSTNGKCEGKDTNWLVKKDDKGETIPNTQKYIDISGYVWLDEHDKKTTVRNDKYDDGETLLKRIIVTLKDKEGNVVKDENGKEYKVGTDDNGRYKFEKVLVENLANYYVEFEYNGLKYQNVTKEAYKDFTKENTSKAEEKTRDAFNEKFAIIENHKSFDKDVNYSHTITYNKVNNHVSTVNFNGMDIPMTSQTDIYNKNISGSYLNRRYKYAKVTNSEAIYEIDNVNLGLYEREQPDMALVKDIENVQLCINGFEYTYQYAQRFSNNPEYNGFNIDVKFGKDNKYASMTYKRPIYKSDVLWEDDSKDLTAYITYRIQVRNESTSLKTKINSLVDYYSKTYSVEGIGTKDDNGNIHYREVKDSEIQKYDSDKYAKLVIDTTDDIGKIESGQSKDIYVKFKLSRNDILNIIHEEEQDSKDKLLNNTAEINSYSIFDKDDKIYAGLDKDSEPGNAIPGDVKTYEDDTDSAPGFDIVYRTNRTLSGMVFLDSTSDELKTGKIREGNGYYDSGESKIKGVEVILESTDKNQEGKSYIDPIETTTDENGKFTIEGFIPGNYILKYKWGGQTYIDKNNNEQTITVQDYKGTIYDRGRKANPDAKDWYKVSEKHQFSDAIDDWGKRKEFDERLNDIQQKVAEDGKNYSTNVVNTEDKMISTTYNMEFGIELKEIPDGVYEVNNIDFGIVERARQSIELVKRIDSIKLVLANGQTMVDSKIGEDGKVTGTKIAYQLPSKDEKGFAKIEIDNELIQGATIEVTYRFVVKNNSEIDVGNEEYYKFGSKGSFLNNKNNSQGYTYEIEVEKNKKFYVDYKDVVKIKSHIIADYLDKGLPNIENENWTQVTDSEINSKVIGDAVFGNYKIVSNKKVYYTKALENQEILPGESKSTPDLKISQLLTTTKGINFNNEAEIIKLSKNGGSTIRYITPGNYIPEGKNCELDDSQAEEVIILPSTGKNLNFVLPITVSILAFIVLGVGIVLIKIKVLDTKK